MANTAFVRTNTTGGAGTDLDGIATTAIANNDWAIVNKSNNQYFYQYQSTSASSEISPRVIKPDDNGGNGRWILQNPKISLASESSGDMYYRNAAGSLARVGIGSSGTLLGSSAGKPVWLSIIGRVLNIVVASASSAASTTATSEVPTGLKASITVSSTKNKVLILTSISAYVEAGVGGNGKGLFYLRKGAAGSGVPIATGSIHTSVNSDASQKVSVVALQGVNTPATLTASTYAVYMKEAGSGGGYTIRTNYDNNTKSTITLLEILQ